MSASKKRFLDSAYGVEDPDETKALYRDWAETYEQEVRANGYVTPQRCARALAAAVADKAAPLLDLGCGTGLSGEAFRETGFSTIDGTDFSEQMLAYARRKPGLYRKLVLGDLNNPLPAARGDYAHIAAVGVFSPGHGPPELIDLVMNVLEPGGCFVFSLNDHALEDPEYDAHVRAMTDQGVAEVVSRDYGDHLPKKALKAAVLVLRRR